MKHLKLFAAAALAALTLASCDPADKVQAISVNASIDEAALAETDIEVESYTVTFTNANTGLKATAQTENGIATVEGLTPGLYNVNATATVNTGATNFIVSGGLDNVNLTTDGQEVVIKVTAAEESALIFKEIYYAGCTIPAPSETDPNATATYFRDQFYEVYNNSANTVYVDGLCIAETVFADYTFTTRYEYTGFPADEYVFVQVVWQIPGTGHEYPVAPGESIVIAQWGTNHKADELTHGTSPVDLSGADFEALEEEKTLWNGMVLTNNPAVNMQMTVNAKGFPVYQWLTSTSGSRYIIFKPSEEFNPDNLIQADNEPTLNSIAQPVLISDIYDAVEAVSGEERLNFLGLPASLDAGAIWVSSPNGYNGESISRKIARTEEDGRIVYQDTNNTTEDFEVNKTPEIRRNGAKVPSWNTWNK